MSTPKTAPIRCPRCKSDRVDILQAMVGANGIDGVLEGGEPAWDDNGFKPDYDGVEPLLNAKGEVRCMCRGCTHFWWAKQITDPTLLERENERRHKEAVRLVAALFKDMRSREVLDETLQVGTRAELREWQEGWITLIERQLAAADTRRAEA